MLRFCSPSLPAEPRSVAHSWSRSALASPRAARAAQRGRRGRPTTRPYPHARVAVPIEWGIAYRFD
eukprot:6379467-Pyramimonas_sp.AAC.1